jgi:hypothetical protein
MATATFGTAFAKWFITTKLGGWVQIKFDTFMEYLAQKYDIEVAKKQSKFEQDYPLMKQRIEKLEKWSHPDRQKQFNKVIKELERQINE